LPGLDGHYVVVLAPSTPQSGVTSDVALVVGWAYPVDARGIVTLQQVGNPQEPGVGTPQPAITITLTDPQQRLTQCKAQKWLTLRRHTPLAVRFATRASAQDIGDWDLDVVERTLGTRGVAVQPHRWVVERTFGWLSRYLRMGKDYERKVQTSEALIELAMIRLLVVRLGRQP